MFDKIKKLIEKPALFTDGTSVFWKDEHISRFLLDTHLNPSLDAASRKPDFINRSVSWIKEIAPLAHYKKLLDLGCGPGLYAQRFAQAGYEVTGLDFSHRSISYAKEQAARSNLNITYLEQDYMVMNPKFGYDIITLIYCDFGVLSTKARRILLEKIYISLNPHGKFIFDVFTPVQHANKPESHTWAYCGSGGFWSPEPHINLNSFYRYDQDNTVMNQTIIIEEDKIKSYNIWEHCFTKPDLIAEMKAAGFTKHSIYGSIDGKALSDNTDTLCGVFTK